MKKYWTSEEILKLKEDYAAGKRIKTIANELGRSSSAVNKTITRLAITRRTERAIRGQSYIKLPARAKSSRQSHNLPRKFKHSVSFITVTQYLRDKGYIVSKFSDPIPINCYKDEKEIFRVGNALMSKAKMLLFANRIRVNENKPIFSLGEILGY